MDAARALASLTSRERVTRHALLALTSLASIAYVAHLTMPVIADGGARSCATLARARSGFLSRTGFARARAMWALGDRANARKALLENGLATACVEVVTRREMESEAREAASATLMEVAKDERGLAALEADGNGIRALEDVHEEYVRAMRGSGWWFARRDGDVPEPSAAATRANVAFVLERLKTRESTRARE